jgi:integrase
MAGLTALQVKNAKPGRHADGRGLYLFVRDSNSRSWILRTQVNGKRSDIGLGSAASLSLAQARVKASTVRAQIVSGEWVKPTAVKRKVEVAVEVVVPTFAEAAGACHEAIKDGWSNQRHRESWLASLEGHIYPRFGSTPVDQVTSLMVRDALAPIWLTIPETAGRIFQRVRTVLDFAHIHGWCPHEASLRSVTRGLPRQPTEERHYPAMRYEDVPSLFKKFAAMPPVAAREALAFTILNAVRSGETRHAVWSEIDLDAATWTIPASRMKMKKEHCVPLTSQALAILARRWPLRAHDAGYIFSSYGTKPLSDMTMSKMLRDMGYPGITVHGFRSSFTDWAAETTEFRKEVVDKALAHKLVDRVEAAYRRTDFFERRKDLMTVWANHCAPLCPAPQAVVQQPAPGPATQTSFFDSLIIDRIPEPRIDG